MSSKVFKSFDQAAATYDAAAAFQQDVARTLVQGIDSPAPASVLDIGCGTGFVTALVAERWPHAQITVLDAAPAMLQATCEKVAQAKPLLMDAAALPLPQKFDLILSSMMLHWMDRAAHHTRIWRSMLTKGGSLHVALPVAGSLWEWKNLCAAEDAQDGLWPFPCAASFNGAAAETTVRPCSLRFASAHDFLRSMKDTGAHTPDPSHTPLSAPALRRVLKNSPRPFDVTYQILFLRAKNLG